MAERLGVGLIGAGFIGEFHVRSWIGVRHADIRGVVSRTRESAEKLAALAREAGAGDARVFGSAGEMVADPAIDAVWILTPNDARLAVMEEVASAGKGRLRGVACEKPLARNVAEARRMLELVRQPAEPLSGRGIRRTGREADIFADGERRAPQRERRPVDRRPLMDERPIDDVPDVGSQPRSGVTVKPPTSAVQRLGDDGFIRAGVEPEQAESLRHPRRRTPCGEAARRAQPQHVSGALSRCRRAVHAHEAWRRPATRAPCREIATAGRL